MDKLGRLYTLPEYKIFEKLIDNIVIGLQNDTFKSAEKLEEFLAIKWTRAAMIQLKVQMANINLTAMRRQREQSQKELEQELERQQDGIINNI